MSKPETRKVGNGPGPGRGVRGRPEGMKLDKGVFSRLLKMLFSQYKGSLIFVAFCVIFGSIATSSASVYLKILISTVIEPGVKFGFDAVAGTLTVLILIMASVYLCNVVLNFFQTRRMAVVTQGFLNDLREKLFKKMQHLPVKYFDTHPHGDVMSVYTNDVDTIRQLISQSLPNVFMSMLTMSVTFIIMISFSVWLTLIVLLAIIAMTQVTKKIGGKSAKYFIKQQNSLGKVEGYIEEMMHGQKVIKVFCHEEESKKEFDKVNEQLFDDANKANTFANILMPIMGNIGNLLYVLVAFVGGLLSAFNVPNLTLHGFNALDMSVIVAFLPMSRGFSMNISQVSQQINAVVMAMAGARRIFDLMDQEEETDEGYVTLVNAEYNENGELVEAKGRTGHWAWKHPHGDGTLTYTELKGDIRMYDVDFAYVEGKTVLHDVTLYAEPGQKVAFVGATGAGKTTITNLINRFYDIADGKVRYDGININKIKKADLRHSLGIVLQETNLFTGTVMDNIRYGKLDATDEECIEAAKLANAHDFIMRLPDGYNTMLTNDGSNLSQGQRQLLSIARAAVCNAPVMIMDEATSSIDTRTEALVQSGTDRLMHGRTVFIIAHRLSTVQNADVIMVLDHGHIIERGNHEELIAKKGTYYRLYTGAVELE